METGLRGRTALVTGGASGTGKGIALALAKEGVSLAVASRRPDPEAIEQIRSRGVACHAIKAEVSREGEVVRAHDRPAAREHPHRQLHLPFHPLLPGDRLPRLKDGPEKLDGESCRSDGAVPGHFPTRLTANIPPGIEKKIIELIPARRFGETEEVGRAAVMLLSDRLSRHTLGADLVVDGGLHLRPLPLLEEEEILRLNLPDEEARRTPGHESSPRTP